MQFLVPNQKEIRRNSNFLIFYEKNKKSLKVGLLFFMRNLKMCQDHEFNMKKSTIGTQNRVTSLKLSIFDRFITPFPSTENNK